MSFSAANRSPSHDPGRADGIRDVRIPPIGLTGTVQVPIAAYSLVVFAHGSGSSRLEKHPGVVRPDVPLGSPRSFRSQIIEECVPKTTIVRRGRTSMREFVRSRRFVGISSRPFLAARAFTSQTLRPASREMLLENSLNYKASPTLSLDSGPNNSSFGTPAQHKKMESARCGLLKLHR